MESLLFLIPLSLVVLGLAVWLLFWAVNSGQYDDIDREGEEILFDDDPAPAAADSAKEARRDDP
ncbi:MAG: cbb3-type cytochrome oxidase assembly protein CcoS [Porticoccaceae bacterium]|jgi:cbb3-type cytochrome oxidase maturation protein|nr:cbb3-type cytochrome oxidase assembly protein CcoS [Porticoccaceae bacterium]MEA3300382.1 cbb3-type cytochrome oxidase assembly protein CcoS [Pseudomonadota bacterium]HLS98786.1 cbb3-type cytochrome oxidase assembly protein CcoS [Porticoccaceae bacterium]